MVLMDSRRSMERHIFIEGFKVDESINEAGL